MWIAGNKCVVPERRIAVRLGAAYAGQTVLTQVFLSAVAGNDIGLLRIEESSQLGLGLALSLW